MKQIISLLKIELILTKRQAAYFLLSVGMPTLFYLFFSGLYGSQGSQEFMRNYLLSMTAFSMMSTAIFSFPASLQQDKLQNWQKILRHSPISMVNYYISKVFSLMVDYLISILVVFSVGHFIRQVQLPLGDWLLAALLLILGSTVFLALGLLLSLLPSMQLTSILGNICYMGLAVLGGLWMPINLFPSWMQSIGKSLPTYQLMQLIYHYLEKRSLDLLAVAYLLLLTVFLFGLTFAIKKKLEVD